MASLSDMPARTSGLAGLKQRTFSAASTLEGSTATRMASRLAASGGGKTYGLDHYLKGALAGGICCSFTHGALCPVDVVKTKIQLEPEVYNKGMVTGFKQVIEAE